MKMTISNAQSILKIETPFTTGDLKTAYKKAMLSSHPDKGGSTEATQAINKAYQTLKKIASATTEERPIENDWFIRKNDLHPLHTNRLPALFTFESLLEMQFNIVKELTVENLYSIDHIHKYGGIFFQKDGKDYNVGATYGNWNEFSITEISAGGRRGKTCKQLHFVCNIFGKDYGEHSHIITNPLRDWFGNDFSFTELYSRLCDCIEREETQFQGITVKYELMSDFCTRVQLNKDGTFIYASLYETKSVDILNPFTLRDVYKKLKVIPEKFTIRHLVAALVHGQFYRCKCNQYLTDDYALDAALMFREGYIDNPLSLASDWHGERKDGCTRVYMSNNESKTVNFGKHSNESYSINIKLDNEYPLVDLNEDTLTLESVNQLELKAS